MSLSVCSNMWPMCRLPVTFGGGSRIVNEDLSPRSTESGVGWAKSLSRTQYSAQWSSMAVGSYALGKSCGMRVVSEPRDFAQKPRFHKDFRQGITLHSSRFGNPAFRRPACHQREKPKAAPSMDAAFVAYKIAPA